MKNISGKTFKDLANPDPKTIIENWHRTGLLHGCHDPENLALCLHTQVKFNETHGIDPDFNRISIPLLVRLFEMSKTIKRNNFVNYLIEVAWPNVFTFKTKAIPPRQPKDKIHNINIEANWLEESVKKWAKEIDEHFRNTKDREIIFCGMRKLDDGTLVMHYA